MTVYVVMYKDTETSSKEIWAIFAKADQAVEECHQKSTENLTGQVAWRVVPWALDDEYEPDKEGGE